MRSKVKYWAMNNLFELDKNGISSGLRVNFYTWLATI